MNLAYETSPYIRKDVSVKRMMIDVLIALTPVTVFACIQFKLKAIILILISVSTMVLTEVISLKVQHKKEFKNKFTVNNILAPSISGLIFALLLPTGASLGMLCYATFICAFVGIFISKMVFGGLGSNIFNPAAATRIIFTVCFSSLLVYGVGATFDTFAGATVLETVKNGGIMAYKDALAEYSMLDLFIGKVPGCIGEVSSLLILIGAVYLFVRKSADWRPMISMLLSFTVTMFFVGLLYMGLVNNGLNPFEFTLFEVLSGGLLFGVAFMITDPVTSPITKGGRVLYGCLAGCLVAIMRLCSGLPEGVAYAILIVNACVPLIDYYKWSKSKYTFSLFLTVILIVASTIAICGGAVMKKNFNIVGIIFLCSIIVGLALLIYIKRRGAKHE